MDERAERHGELPSDRPRLGAAAAKETRRHFALDGMEHPRYSDQVPAGYSVQYRRHQSRSPWGQKHPRLQLRPIPSFLRLVAAQLLRLGPDHARCHCRSKTTGDYVDRECSNWVQPAAVAHSVVPGLAELAEGTPARNRSQSLLAWLQLEDQFGEKECCSWMQ